MNIEHEGDGDKRREMITDIVRRWQKKNPKDMKAFAKSLHFMRQHAPRENQAHAYSMTVPRELHAQIELVTGTDDDKRFLNSKKELEWFKSTFPEFVIPYDGSEKEA